MRKYKVTGLPERSNIGAVPKYAPGGAYGPGDGIKKFLRKAKDNTWLTANYGKLNTNATNYVPTIGLNTIMGSPKKGFHDFNTNIGGDKGGLAANLKYQYYGPFMSGQRNFQGSAGAEAYYDQDKYGAQFFAGPNIPLGSSAKHRDDELRRGRFRFDIMPNLNVSMWDQIGDTETKYYQPAPNEPIVSTEVPKGAKLDWGYGLDLKGEYRFKKIPLSLFGRASYQADLVRDSTSSGAQYTPADMVWVDSDNPDQISGQFGPDGQTYTLGPDYVGGNEVISSSKDEGWKTDNKFNFTLGARYNLDNLRFNPKNKSKRKIKELEENDPYYNPGVRNSQGSIEGVNEELYEQKHGGPHDPPSYEDAMQAYMEAELTDKEVEQYKAGGYILEELEEGGEDDDVVRPHGDPYEYKKVNGKYYTRKREGEYDQEYPIGEGPAWNLASDEAEDGIKYNVFKEEKPKPVVENSFQQYDFKNPKNFEAQYWNNVKLDQSQDALKPECFSNQLPLLNLNGADPNAEYNAWVAAKPQYRRAPSWLDKNVFKPIGKEIDKFRKTDFGPIGDMAEFAIVEPVKMAANLASDFYNEPNKTSGTVLQMMEDGVMLLPRIAAESIYTDFINPEAEFDWNNIGSEKSLQRAGEIATLLPMLPNVFGTATKTAANTAKVTNKVDDVVNVTNKTKKTIPRKTATKPKQPLQLESADMKFDRALADINRKSSDNPILTRVFNEGEFADDLSGLKVENRTLVDGTTQARRTKHFGTKGEGAFMQGGDDVYNNMYIGNIDDVSDASGAHLRDFHAGDTYFYSPNETFTLSDKGVYLTSDPATYERLYNSGKKVRLEPGVFNETKKIDEFISTSDKKILEDYSKYYEKNPSKVGSKKISTKDVNRNPGPQFNRIDQAGHQYDILQELENIENIPFMVRDGMNSRASMTYSKNGKLNPLFDFDPRFSANELKNQGYDISFYNQWVNLPQKVRQAELDKLVKFYADDVLPGKVSPSYRGGASQYQEYYIRVLDELQMLHDKAGSGLKYKKGGYLEVELTDKEVEQYKAGGYVLEELVDGGEDDIVRPKGDPYEYKKVGDKYYTRKREGEWNQEYAEGDGPKWNLASGEPEDAIKYNVFKEERPKPAFKKTITPLLYDPNDPSNFESRYNNEFKLDQSQDGLKPEYFNASNLPLLNLDGSDPNAEYNEWLANKPVNKRVPSWVEKNVFKPVGDLYDKFQNTSLGPIDDATNFVNDMFVQPIVDLASDTYNDPNKVAGEVMQMMVDAGTLPFDATKEAIRTNIVNPDAEFDTSVLGDPKSLERFGQIAAVLPAIPSVFGKAAKTTAVTNKVDDVVNVTNKTKKTISRPKANTTTAMAETTSGNVVPVNNLQKVKNSPYMKGSDGKTYLRESEYNNFTGTRKANLDKKIANGEVEVLRQTPDGNAYLLSDKSIANIDKTVKTKLDRMKTDKGRQLTFEQEKAYIKKEFPELDDAAANQAANQAVDARIAEVESLYKNKNYQEAYYDLEEMNAHMEIGDDVITSTQYQPEQVANFDKTINPVNQNANMRFHPGLADDAAVVSHEGAHITAPGRNLPIEDEILNAVGSPKNLSAQDQVAYDYLVATSKKRKKLINDMRNHDPANANLSEAELIDKYSNLGQSKGDIFTGDYTFANDIKKVQQLSSEVLPYAQELKQVLLDRGLIDDWFQEITPDILAKAKQTLSQEPAGFYTADMLGNVENATSTTRLLDITDPSRYQQLSNSLNKVAPVAVPAAAVGTGTMMNEQDGGFMERELTKEDALKYAQNGYIVEEMHEGGSPHSHPHEDEVTVAGSRKDPPLTYTQKLAAYDDSLAAYNWAKDNYYYNPKTMGEWDYDFLVNNALKYHDPKSKTNYGTWMDTDNDDKTDKYIEGLTFEEYMDKWRGSDQYVDKMFDMAERFNVKPFVYTQSDSYPDQPMYVKPTYPTKPTMKEAYKSVDKEKYPTFEDFKFAAEFYKEHGENPDPSDLPSSRLPAPPPPEYKVEDIEPEIEIEKLDVIQPEFLSNDAELPELEEREEVEGVDYKIKRGPYFTQGSGFLDLQKGLVGTAGRTGRRLKYKGPKLKWGERRVPIEDEQLYPEGFAPKFYNQGGFMEVDLTNKQVDKYRARGYTVEKIK